MMHQTLQPRRARFAALSLIWLMGLLLCALLWWTVLDARGQAANEETANGYVFIVREGDFWERVANLTGVPVAEIKAANAGVERPNDWLLAGERLFIPTGSIVVDQYHTVAAGESWNSIAARYGISAELLRAVNPLPPRSGNLLFRGEQLLIPPSPAALAAARATAEAGAPLTGTATTVATPAPTTLAVAIPTVAATATPLPTVAPTIAATVTLTPTLTIAATPVITPAAAVTATPVATATAEEPAATRFDLPACPQRFSEYPVIMGSLINDQSPGTDAVVAFLAACEALVPDGVAQADWTGDGVEDLVVVYMNPSADQIFVESDLVIFNSGATGYSLAFRARAAGEVRLLTVDDINDDSRPDVVWVDTTCGASTCFDTVNVRSWDGRNWADWTEGTITMAYAEISLVEAGELGQGQDIVLEGGIYGSVGAGPQRSRTEVWASVEGAPYALVEKVYSRSDCLYHTVLDANRAFLDAPATGFTAATALYTRAADDESLIKCWVRPNELTELRSFSLFRLAVIAGYEGDAAGVATYVARLGQEYPGSVYAAAGELFLNRYTARGSAAAACGEVTTFAENNAATWEILADYGYTNPSFEAADVCPVLKMDEADETETGAADEAAPAVTPLNPALAAIAPCPTGLAGYADALPAVLAASAASDPALAETWLRACGAIGPDRGAVVWAELNDDGVPDAIVFPSRISDLGHGPNGAEGAVLIFHGRADGSYHLVAQPQLLGLPMPLAVDDLNADGRLDVAWSVTACAESCLTEVSIYTWDGDAYVALIRPGAVIAEGTATFSPVPAGDPGAGYQLVLQGGVSGTPEGGLATPHTEIWQSIAGGIYQRLRWTYDRTSPGSACLGLRLIEADVALQAQAITGYGPAIALYTAALDPALEACSIFGLPADQELFLLQGLAAFRLIQAQALSGDFAAAEKSLDALTALQPESAYATVAATWLSEFQATVNPVAACAAVRPLFDATPALWQITDHFGYNHPALGADQICYVP